jgi:hypothetical protein
VNVPGLVVVGLVALGLGVVAANAAPLVTAAPMTPPATIELATAPAARSIRNLFIRFSPPFQVGSELVVGTLGRDARAAT